MIFRLTDFNISGHNIQFNELQPTMFFIEIIKEEKETSAADGALKH